MQVENLELNYVWHENVCSLPWCIWLHLDKNLDCLFSLNMPVKVQWVKGLSAINGPKKVENNLLFVVLTHVSFYVSEPSQDDKLSFMQ